jgi:ectoine hydroxylase-related dioxygenase (phytanoyl-CoA dioxygenase family)
MTAVFARTAATPEGNLYESFAREGYLILHDVLGVDEVDACTAALAAIRGQHPELTVPPTAPARDRIDSMVRLAQAGNALDAVERIALHPTVCDALRQMFDQEPVARYTRLLAQSPGALAANAERQGTPHLHNFGMSTHPPGGRAIVWTPVDDVHPDAGPMWFVPRSHLELAAFPDRLLDAIPDSRNRLHHLWKHGATAEVWLDWHGKVGDYSMAMLADWLKASGAQPVPVMLRRGDVLIFSNDLLHGTLRACNPDIPRRALFTHYHADGRELWELGDAVGSDVNPRGPRFFETREWVRRERGLMDPEGLRRFYASLKGFFDPPSRQDHLDRE